MATLKPEYRDPILRQIERARLTLQWVGDLVGGEMIEKRDYTRNYLGFDRVSQAHLDELTVLANQIARGAVRFSNAGGEIVVVGRFGEPPKEN